MPEDNVPANQAPNYLEIIGQSPVVSAPNYLELANEPPPPDISPQSDYAQVLNIIDKNFQPEPLDERSEDVLVQTKLVARRFSQGDFHVPAAYIEVLRKNGLEEISDTFRNREWMSNITADAYKQFNTFMVKNGYDQIQGQNVEGIKRELHAAFIADAMLRHTPVYGPERTKLVGGAIRQVLQDEMKRRQQSVQDQSGVSAFSETIGPGSQERTMQYDAFVTNAEEVSKLSDADLETLWRTAVYYSEEEDRPKNPVEQTIFDERRKFHGDKLMPYKTGQYLDEKFFGQFPTPMTGEQRGQFKSGFFKGKKFDLNTYMRMMPELLGGDWAKVLRRRVDDSVQQYNYFRSGLSKSAAGDIFSPDGVNVFDLVPGEAIQRLEALKMTRGQQEIPDVKPGKTRTVYRANQILEAAGTMGPEAAANEVLKAGYENGLAAMQEWEQQQAAEDMALRGATPEEVARAGVLRNAWQNVNEAIFVPFQTGAEIVRDIDKRVVEHSPWLQHTLSTATRFWTDDRNSQISDKVESVTRTAAILLRHLPRRLQALTGLKDGLKRQKGDVLIPSTEQFPWLKNTDSGVLQDIFMEENSPMKAYNEYYSKSFAEWDRVTQTLLDDPDASVMEKFRAGLQATGYGLFHMVAPTFNAIFEDPALGVTFMAAGLAKPNPNAMFQRAITAERLSQHLYDIGTHRPHMVRPIKAKLESILDRSLKDPNTEASTLSALDDAVGVLSTLEKEWAKTGHFKPGDFAQVLYRIWPEISDDMGVMGQMLGTKITEKGYGWLERSSNDVRRLFGKGPAKPNKMISLMLNDLPRTGDWLSPLTEVIDIRKRVFGSEATWNEVARIHQDFTAKNGRAPRGSEILNQLPDDIQVIYGYMMEADHAAMTGLWDRLGAAMGKGEYAKELKQFSQNATQLLDDMVQTTVDTAHAATEWNVYRTRMTTLADIAINKTQSKADRLRLDAQMMREIQAKDAATPEAAEAILKEAKRKDSIAESLDTQITAMTNSKQRIDTHDFRQGPIGLERDVFGDALNTNVIEMLLDADPVLFDGLDASALFEVTHKAAPEKAVKTALNERLALEKRATELKGSLKKVQKDPVGSDKRLASLKKELKETQKKHKEASKKPVSTDEVFADGQIIERPRTADELYGAKISELEKAIAERTEAVKSGVSDEFYRLAGEIIDNKQQYKKAVDKHQKLKKGYPTYTVNSKGMELFWNKARYGGPGERLFMKHAVEAADVKSLKSLQKHRVLEGNPYSIASAPLSHKGYILRQQLLTLKNQMAGALARVNELHEIQMKMPEKARTILGRAQREGVEPVQLYKDYPELKKVYDWMLDRTKPKPDDAAQWEQVQNYFNEEKRFQMEILDLASARLPKAVLENWKQKLYDPPSYGLYERPGLLADPKARQAIASIRKESRVSQSKIPMREEGDRFLFKRDVNKWRVRIEEPNRVVDQLFDDKHGARQFLLENYGKDTAELANKMGKDGYIEGQTLHGDNLTIGRPIGKELALLDPVTKGYGTPTARLKAFNDFIRDIFLDGMLDSFNIYGDAVLTPEQFNNLKQGWQNYKTLSVYQYVPEDPKAFGVISGKYVKRSVLAELNRTMRSWDNMSHYLDGLREAFQTYGSTKDVPKEIAEKIPGMALKGLNTLGNIARNSLITWSVKAYAQQMPFNMFCDHLAGTKVFAPENWGTLAQAWGETGIKGKKLSHTVPYYNEMRDNGILTGFYEHKSAALRKEIAGLHKLMDKKEAQALLDRRVKLRDKLEASDSPALKTQLEADIITIQSRLNELEAGFTRKMGRWLGGFLLERSNRLGIPVSKVQTTMRQLFSWQDEAFKAAQYINLRKRGLTPEMATMQVKRFSQNYAEIPHWFRAATPDWARSLVTSFPFEAARILSNGMRFVPSRTLGWFSILPGLNLLSMASAGIPMDRMEGILRQRGSKSAISDVSMFATNLFMFDHNTGDLATQMDFGSAIPYGDMVGGYGMIRNAMDEQWPVEERGFLGHMAGITAGVASQFYLNRPLWNIAMMGMTGRNTFDGRKMWSNKDSLATKSKIFMRHLFENYLPPLAPGGRDFNAILDSFDERYTSAGRKIGKQPFSAILKSLLNVDARGKLVENAQDLFGLKTAKRGNLTNDIDLAVSETYRAVEMFGLAGEEAPVMGERRDFQNLIAQLRHPNLTPEDHKRLMKDFNEYMTKETVMRTSTVELAKSPSERQRLLVQQRMYENGLHSFFGAQSVELQAFVMARLDAMKVNNRLLKELKGLMLYTDRGRMSRPSDPQLVRNALTIIQQRIDEAGHSPVLDDVKKGLMRILPVSERLWQREQRRMERKPELKERVLKRLMERQE